LDLLARLPFLPETAIGPLIGLRGDGYLYRCLSRLRSAQVIATIRPALRRGPNPDLFFLTAQGVEALARARRVTPSEVVRRNRLGQVDLLRRLASLALLQSCYTLVALLVASRPAPSRLGTWKFPWRRRLQRPTAKGPTTLSLPAFAFLSWESHAAAYALLPDLGVPVQAYRLAVDHLFVVRAREQAAAPTLVIATADRARTRDWERLLEDVRHRRHEAPLDARVATWTELRAEVATLSRQTRAVGVRRERPMSKPPPPAIAPESPSFSPLVSDIGSPAGVGLPATARLGRIALDLTPADRSLLNLVARHPFRSTSDIATALDWRETSTRQRRERLVVLGLLRELGMEAVGPGNCASLVEVTRPGLALVAAGYGLPLGAARRWLGLTGGGPDRRVGSRRKLLKDFAHTRGVDALFLGLMRQAREARARGEDEQLVEWRNSAECGRGYLRPDGYGVYRRGEHAYGFFLEYDRGTMGFGDYLEKLAAYYQYQESRSYTRDYDGFPTILVVATTDGAEKRLAQAARVAAIGRAGELPLLLTSEARIHGDSNLLNGLLGPIWCSPENATRRPWLTGPGLPSASRRT
ncbi:MAG TPA: replication-relaxation family protein, partial [Chloroflexota bacterium]|nr:replication-relaxation family protein [Chloroflexota bacterium]